MRILHFLPDIGISNGVMSVILNYAKAMPDDIVFDIMYFHDTAETKQSEVESLGGRVYKIDPPSPKDLLSGKMNSFFAAHKNEWSALHIHCPHFAVFIAPAAKEAGIKRIAMHCHSTWYSLNPHNVTRNKLLYLLGKPFVDTRFACGRDAGRFWYGNDKNFIGLNNAIDCKQFRFNSETRNLKRQMLGVTDKLVIGHIGRVDQRQKNHIFLLKVFSEIKKINPNAVLLMAGAVADDELNSLATELQIENDIFFLGMRNDIPELCQAFDVFVFPSFWEGLPVSVVEAQAAGLPVLMSDSITDEVCITQNAYMMSLDDAPSMWANRVLSLSCNDLNRDTFEEMIDKGWDLYHNSKTLVSYYTNTDV